MAHIDAIFYYKMYSSLACWKTFKQIDCELKKLNSKTAKLKYLKSNIRIRVLGMGWSDLHTPWSINGKYYTPEKLTVKLKYIISERTKEKYY